MIAFSDRMIKQYIAAVDSSQSSTVGLIKQYVDSVLDYTSQYGSENSISYSANNLKGNPSVYPSYGDLTNSFHFRTYGLWWSSKLPSYNMIRFHSSGLHPRSQDYIVVKYEESVCPIAMRIFEVYNPGALVKILCFCSEDDRWDVLWHGPPEFCPAGSRVFSPNLKRISYLTNTFRLEFNHEHLSYHYALDAIQLTGFKASHEDLLRILNTSSTSNSFVDTAESIPCLESNDEAVHMKKNGSFSLEQLPNEVLVLIFTFLDLTSLCSAAQVSRSFKKLSYDSGLYYDLDLQPYWDKINDPVLKALGKRCTSVRRLNLSWCGVKRGLTFSSVAQFLKRNCSMLSCLKLSNCDFDGHGCLKAIADSCPLLQVLELRNFRGNTENMDYAEIGRLVNLRYLDLCCSYILQHQLLSIIRHCSRLEHLLLDSCFLVTNFNEIAEEIAQNLSHIKTLDFRRAKSLAGVGISAIASKCFDLVEIDLGWCLGVGVANGCIVQLVTQCRKLKKLFLTAMRTISDAEVLAIAENCDQLEQLDILGILFVSVQSIERVLQQCKNLKLLDISFCGAEVKSAHQRLCSTYPNVSLMCDVHKYCCVYDIIEL